MPPSYRAEERRLNGMVWETASDPLRTVRRGLGYVMMLSLLIALQVVQVAILWLHDWLPLPPLNDVGAVQAADSRAHLVRVTLIQSLPFTIGLIGSIGAATQGHYPGWLWPWLWISYGLLFAGELRAWWLPYVMRPEPERAARYRAMFGATHAFLPEHFGVRPNTLHCVLHGATALTLVTLAVSSLSGS